MKAYVWPFRTPDVCTGFWTEANWDDWVEGFRPADYYGARDDERAWRAYLNAKAREERLAFYVRHGAVQLCSRCDAALWPNERCGCDDDTWASCPECHEAGSVRPGHRVCLRCRLAPAPKPRGEQ